MCTEVPELSTTATQAALEENALKRQYPPASHRTLFGGTVRASILASAVCAGVWLGILPHELDGRFSLASRRNQTVQMRPSLCSGIKAAGSDVPPGYTLVDIRRIGDDCFALLKADDTDASPALGLGSGVADVFGPDGRLTVRFYAIARPNGQWELFEYRRLPVLDAVRLKAQG
jgi:hypothetical protein